MDFEQEQTWRRLASDGNYDTYYCTATDEERESFRIWVKSLLRSQSVLVEFVKTNGDIRVMNCTLSETLGAKHQAVSHLNETANNTTVTDRKKNDDVCAVWDLTLGAWRSFRWDKLKRIDFKINSN